MILTPKISDPEFDEVSRTNYQFLGNREQKNGMLSTKPKRVGDSKLVSSVKITAGKKGRKRGEREGRKERESY